MGFALQFVVDQPTNSRLRSLFTCIKRAAFLLIAWQFVWMGCGCASTTYRYSQFHPNDYERPEVVVERGKPHKVLDKLAWCVGIPEKVFTLNSKTNNHQVTDETIDQVKQYLEENDITDVYVSVDDYNPGLQWRRLKENQMVSPFWKYTVGAGAWLGYTLFPNRVFGGDEYNPFTNTLIVSSDVPALVLAEAAYAKDIRQRTHPGLYATVNDLPIVSLWRHSLATSDILSYARTQKDWDKEREAYEVLYPLVGSTTFGASAHFIPVAGPFLSVAGAAVGQAAGRTVAKAQEPIANTGPPSRVSMASSDSPVESPSQKAANGIRPGNSRSGEIIPANFEEPSEE